MARHRLAAEADYYRLPAPRPVTISPAAFLACPAGLTGSCLPDQLSGLTNLYQFAFEQACEAARSTHPADMLFALWN